ncbi:MAG: hypothetical protein R3C49_27670 [Planctomycetaceae bacterium]
MLPSLLQKSSGNRPNVVFDDIFPEGIACMALAREHRSIVLGTGSGQLIQLNQQGQQKRRERGFDGVHSVAVADNGQFAAVALEKGQLVCLDSKLKTQWKVDVNGEILGLAVSPFGSHIAVSTDALRLYVVTTEKKEVCRVEVAHPLWHLKFLNESPHIIAAAEFSYLGRFQLNGREDWNVRIVNNVGDMDVTGCGTTIALAAYNHGIQIMDQFGEQEGSFAVEGVPGKVSMAANRRRLAALTLEHHVIWMNFEGNVLWSCDMSDDPPHSIAAGPLADRLFLATQSGRFLHLAW